MDDDNLCTECGERKMAGFDHNPAYMCRECGALLAKVGVRFFEIDQDALFDEGARALENGV